MKKILILMLCVILALSIVGCTQSQERTDPYGDETRARTRVSPTPYYNNNIKKILHNLIKFTFR